jgi:hypothetical protein
MIMRAESRCLAGVRVWVDVRSDAGAIAGSLSRRRLRIFSQASSGWGMGTGVSWYVIISFTLAEYDSDVARSV